MTTVGARAEPLDEPAREWAERIRVELSGNILPFWPRYVMDRQRGGFFGTLDSARTVQPGSPRSAVVNARILWTYAAAARLVDPAWRPVADWALAYVTDKFWDVEHGGLFWMVDADGVPLADHKHCYAQAFGIYALAEHFRIAGDPGSLQGAKRLFGLIERHCYDPVAGGYFEGRARDWQPLADLRLSDKDLDCPKTMNTHLHLLEAFTNLMRVWPDGELKARQSEMLELLLDRIIDPATGHLKLFFDAQWRAVGDDHISFGHDIETSWLIMEAAEALGDARLIARSRQTSLKMARAALAGLEADGSLVFSAGSDGHVIDCRRHWWVQAEAVVGFYNAWQMSGEPRFRDASQAAWEFIERHVVDRRHGEWCALVGPSGEPLSEADDPEALLVGPWKCPYHNARVCYEMLDRLTKSQEEAR